jgi:predicted GIY-YIG superfamily endonuclease
MSVQYLPQRDAYDVRWRLDGKQRSRLFRREADAKAYDGKIKARLAERKSRKALSEISPPAKMRQQVYVVGNEEHVKIGRSADPRRRLSGFQTGSPTELRLLHLIATPDAARLEAALHARYAQHRTHGEWFTATPVLVDLAGLAELGPCQVGPGEAH